MKVSRVKIRGKFYIVKRDIKGRFIERTKWTREFNLKQAITEQKRTGSIIQGRSVERMTNVKEIRDKRVRFRPPRQTPFQISVTIQTPDGKFSARSDKTLNRKEAFKDALYNVSRLAADYDNDEADKLLSDIRQGEILADYETVYYAKL